MKRLILLALFGFYCTGLYAIHVTGRISVIRPEKIVFKNIDKDVILTIDIPASGIIKPAELPSVPDLYTIKIGESEEYVFIDTDLHFDGFLDSKNAEASQLSISGLDSHGKFQKIVDKYIAPDGKFDMLIECVAAGELNPIMLPAILFRKPPRTYEQYSTIRDLVPADYAGLSKTWLDKQLESYYPYRLGAPAPMIEGVDKEGRTVTLDDFSGKYIVVDFWASWCGPCKREIAHMKTYYEKYEQKGIRFMSVSMDETKQEWLVANEKEQIPWTSIYVEGGFMNSPYLKSYGFKAIPFIILIDKEGNVIARNMLGETIVEKLDEIIGE